MVSMPNRDLFSIVCITFNQEGLATECLNSIYRQTYKRIELIVCDDCSTDGTVLAVEEWLGNHQNRFENVVFLKNDTNLGISATHDRGLRCATGKYLKYIAGDDILATNCASQIMSFSREHRVTWGQTLVKPFFRSLDDLADIDLPYRRFRKYFSYTPSEQFRMLARSCFLCAPGNFFERSLLEEIGFLDTEFRTFEDWHTWLRLSKAGHAVQLLPIPLVYWRRHEKSITYSAMDTGNTAFCQDQARTIEKYAFPYLENLDWITRKHLSSNLRYLKRMIEEGATRGAHKKARLLKLKDPLWWLEISDFIKNKIVPKRKGL